MTDFIENVPLRDNAWDPNSEVDRLAQRVLERLGDRDQTTFLRYAYGHLSPKEVARIAAEVFLEGTIITCIHCGEPIFLDDNGAGQPLWCHDIGSTVCYDDPKRPIEAGDTTTTAEPARSLGYPRGRRRP